MWDQWSEFDGIAPRKSEEEHRENIPKVVQKALEEMKIVKGDPRLKAIAVAIGPGL